MDMNRITIKLQEALQTASSHASRRSHQGIDVEHLLLAFVEQEGGLASSLLEQAGLSLSSVHQAVEQALAKLPQVQGAGASPGQLHIAARLSQVLAKAEDEQRTLKDDYLSVEHVVLAMVQEGGVFRKLGLTKERLLGALQQIRGSQRVTSQDPEGTYQALEKYGRDLTRLAGQGKLDPVIGR
ncbi:MAG: type VI secretion system ATPase TssH, partial [Nitrospirae bacterium]|nr:type VI secretion system ATPase TssH [Nitrospirota bacterium]